MRRKLARARLLQILGGLAAAGAMLGTGCSEPRSVLLSLDELLPVAENHRLGARERSRPLAVRGPDDSVAQSPGSVLRYFLVVPEGAVLRGRGRIEPAQGPPRKTHVAVHLTPRAGPEETLLSSDAAGRRLDLDADLERWVGRMIELRFVYVSTGEGGAAAGAPRLVWRGLRVEGPASAPPAGTAARPPVAGERPNLFVILFDTLRADRTEPYAATRVRTPAMSKLAASGVTFRNAFANASWTAPSVASLLTSVYPSVHGITGTGWIAARGGKKVTTLRTDLPYLPEILEGAGYRTTAIVNNPFLHDAFGFARGFEKLHAFYQRRRETRETHRTPEAQADLVWDDYVEPMLEARGESPFFLYLHEIDPHHPYDPLPPFDTLYPSDYEGDRDFLRSHRFAYQYKRNPAILDAAGRVHLDAQYDGEVSFMDAYLGRILDRLERAGLREDTWVVFVSDHGEALAEHGVVGHGHTLYDEIVRVPLIFSRFSSRLSLRPGAAPASRVVEANVELVDLPPTLLELAGLPPDASMQGRSLVPLMHRPATGATRASFAQAVYESLYSSDSVRFGSWKLIRNNAVADERPASFELYDLVADPEESRNLWSEEPVLGGTLRQMLAWRHHLDAQRRSAAPTVVDVQELSPELRANLQALGYIE